MSISELEKLLLKPAKPTTIPFSHMKQLMGGDGLAGSSLRIKVGRGVGMCSRIEIEFF